MLWPKRRRPRRIPAAGRNCPVGRVIHAVACRKMRVHDRRVSNSHEEVVDDDVLVVLAQQPPGLVKRLAFLHQLVMGFEEGHV